MNNNVNQPEKDIEQLITETLDRCMSGIDTAPSLRPAVDKKLEEPPRPEKKHIPVRYFAVPAVALALCACLIVTGTHFGMFRWPDRIRTPETKVTAQPVPLAQPEGEGNPSPDGSQQLSLADKLSHVIASCENAGIRFEVHSAEVYEQHTQVFCSVQDLTGDHRIIAGGLALYPYPGFSQDISGPSITYLLNNGCVEEDRRIWYSLDIRYDGIDDRSDRMVTISADNIPIPQVNGEADEWIMETWSVQLPLKSILKDAADYPEKYSEEFFASRLRYTVNEDGTATVVGSVGADSSFLWAALVVPEKLDGHPVTSIADGAFSMFHHLESAVLPDSLTSIGARAFSDCYRLENINFPDSLVSIGDEAFLQANLQNAVLPDTLAFIGENAFRLDVGLVCSVSEDSYAEKYCRKNSIPYRTRETVTPTQPVESFPIEVPDPTVAAESAQWDSWGTTPMPPVESIQAGIPDPAAAAESVQWDSWGVTPMPPVESIQAGIPDPAAAAESVQWDSWGVTPMPPVESIQAGITDPAAAAESVQWDSWGVTPMPPVESIQAGIPDPTVAAESAQWDSWGVTPMPPAVTEESWRKWMVDNDFGSEVNSLRPVGLSCEKGGIRFTVEAAGADDKHLRILCTLKDLQEDRIRPGTSYDVWDFRSLSQDLYVSKNFTLHPFGYNETEQLTACFIVFENNGSPVPVENRPVNISMYDLIIHDWMMMKRLPLIPYYTEYGKPVLSMPLEDATAREMYTSCSRNLSDCRIMDCTDPLDIELAPYIYLSGIGLIDGEFHVRIRYSLIDPHNDDNHIYFDDSRNNSISDDGVIWKTDSDGNTDMEYIIPWDGTEEVTMSVPYVISRIDENWQVSIPLDSIRTDTEDNANVPEDSARWDSWGVTPMPPVEYIQAGIPDPTVAAESAQWNSWGVTPMPPVEFIQAGIPDPTVAAESAQWDSWGTVAVPSAAPEEPWRKWMAESEHPEKADTLRPVGLSCESEGIRFTVEAASVDDESIDLLYSLEDLEGNRINDETHIWGVNDIVCDGISENLPRTNTGIHFTPGRMSAHLSHFVTDGTAIPGKNQPVTFSLDDIGLLSQAILDLAPYLEEYGKSAKAMDLDKSSPGWSLHGDDNSEYPSRILDITNPLDISLNSNIRLDGIGIIDGRCHVRLRYVDNELFLKPSGYHGFRPVHEVAFLSFIPTDERPSYDPCRNTCIVEWYEDGDIEPVEQEFIFSPEKETEIPLYIRSCGGVVNGNWKVELSLDSIWTGPEDYAGADTPGYYESRLTYTLSEDGTAVVKGRTGQEDFMLIRHMVIPAELYGHPVTAIADEAFMDWYGLESVVIPETVTAIGDRAFMGCSSLESVDLPEGLRTIGEQAFFSTSLQKVIIPDSVISLGNQAFIILYPGDKLELEIPRTTELITWCSTNRIPFTIRNSEPAE